MIKTKPMPKYRNQKVAIDGINFDSKREAKRYCELKMLESAGQIDRLELQTKFVLIPKQRHANGKAEREWAYIADFVYIEAGSRVVEDVKGFVTKEYASKRKAMLYFHGITIREIKA